MKKPRRIFLKIKRAKIFLMAFFLMVLSFGCKDSKEKRIELKEGSRIVLIGNNLASRMGEYGHFETELHLRYPDSSLFVRNMARPGNTPGFRIHSARNSPWAFPGAERYASHFDVEPTTEGHFPTEDEWLTKLEADIVLAFFGYNESFAGEAGLEDFKAELQAFIQHSQDQKYNGITAPQLAIISPIAFQDLSD